jgi:hypothetical protein
MEDGPFATVDSEGIGGAHLVDHRREYWVVFMRNTSEEMVRRNVNEANRYGYEAVFSLIIVISIKADQSTTVSLNHDFEDGRDHHPSAASHSMGLNLWREGKSAPANSK